jgi:Predicted unusual protein kinase
MSISEAFAEFDSSPLASASVAQVHTAKLHTGENVIIKVLRPDIEKQIRSDIGLLYELARIAEKF